MSADITPKYASSGKNIFSLIWEEAGMIVLLFVLFVICSTFVPNFFTIRNMEALSLAVSMTGMVACTMMFCLASGNFDLSCSSVVACSGVVVAVVINKTAPSLGDSSVYLGILVALLVGLLVGLVNGLVIAVVRINALITTLATMQIARGIGYIICDGKAVGISQEQFFLLGNTSFLGIPVPVWITAICLIVFGVVLQYTSYGRNTLAIGGNEEATNLAGIRVARTKITIFVVHGLMAAAAGIILASRMTSGQPATSMGFEFEVISACVLGGVSLMGGIASIWFVLAGVLIMGIIQNSMNLLNIPPFYQYVARGVILLAAVIFDRYKQRRVS